MNWLKSISKLVDGIIGISSNKKSNISDGYCHNHYYPSVHFVKCLYKLAAKMYSMPTITLSH